jgi:hypothetical protein
LSLFAYISYQKDKNLEIDNIYITNVTDSSATVVWTTKEPVYGTLAVSTQPIDKDVYYANSTALYYDDRDTIEDEEGNITVERDSSGTRYIHHVTMGSLEPDTKYYFKIKNRLALIRHPETTSFKTVTTNENLNKPEPIYGRIQNSEDDQVIEQGVVLMQRISNDGAKSHYLSTTLREGTYSLDAASVWKEDLSEPYSEQGNDSEKLTVFAYFDDKLKTKSLIVGSDDDQPVPTLIFSEDDQSQKNSSRSLVSYVNASDCVQHTCYGDYSCKDGETCGNCADERPCSCKSEDGSRNCGSVSAGNTCNCRDEEEAPSVCCCNGDTIRDSAACTNCAATDPGWSPQACSAEQEEGFCGEMDDATWGGSGNYCNGSKLWYCGSRDGQGSLVENCEDGCIVEDPGKSDHCNTSGDGGDAPPEDSPCGPNAWGNYGCSSETSINWPQDLVDKVNRGEGNCIMAMCRSNGVGYEIDGCNCNTQCNNPIYRPDDPEEKDCPEGYTFIPGVDALTLLCVPDPAGRAGICCKDETECPEESHELVYDGYDRSDCWYYGEDLFCCSRGGGDSSTCFDSDNENGEICQASNYRDCNGRGTKRCVAKRNGKCEWRQDETCSDVGCSGTDYEQDEVCSNSNFGDCHNFAHKRCTNKELNDKCEWRNDWSCPDSTPAAQCLGVDEMDGEMCNNTTFGQCHSTKNRICDRKNNGDCKWEINRACPEGGDSCDGSHTLEGVACNVSRLTDCHPTRRNRKCTRKGNGDCHWRIDRWCVPGAESELLFAPGSLYSFAGGHVKNYLTRQEYEDQISAHSLNKYINGAHAADSTSVVLAPDTGLYSFEEAGRYSFEFEDEIYYFDIDAPGGWQLYIDLNRNNAPDDGDIILAEEEFVEIEVQKVSEVIKYNLHEGWNLVAFPMVIKGEDTSDIETASDLIKHFTDNGADVTHVAGYNSGFQIYTVREDYEGNDSGYGDNFKIYPGLGYFVRSHNDVTVGIQGRKISDSLQIRLKPSWNLIGFYNENQSVFSSLELLKDINQEGIDARILSRWKNGKYEGLVIDEETIYGDDFDIYPSKGYWVRMDGDEIEKYKP